MDNDNEIGSDNIKLSEPKEYRGTERNRKFKKHRFYRNLLGTFGISRNEKDYQGTPFPAYTAYISAYKKSIFLNRGNGRDVHFLAVSIDNDWREPFDAPEAFTGSISKGVPMRPPHVHDR